jgi:multiple sugar transport system permease protein
VTTTTAPGTGTSHKANNVTSDRSRQENRLGQKLVLPAIALMLIVTAFPMLRAIWLSVYNYSLAAPDDR